MRILTSILLVFSSLLALASASLAYSVSLQRDQALALAGETLETKAILMRHTSGCLQDLVTCRETSEALARTAEDICR